MTNERRSYAFHRSVASLTWHHGEKKISSCSPSSFLLVLFSLGRLALGRTRRKGFGNAVALYQATGASYY